MRRELKEARFYLLESRASIVRDFGRSDTINFLFNRIESALKEIVIEVSQMEKVTQLKE